MLPLDIYGTEYVRVFLLDINEMTRNDLWLNVKGNYVFFVGKIHKQWAITEKIDELTLLFFHSKDGKRWFILNQG